MTTRNQAPRTIAVRMTRGQRDHLAQLVKWEIERIEDMAADPKEGFTLSAKVASLVDLHNLEKVLGLDIDQPKPGGSKHD